MKTGFFAHAALAIAITVNASAALAVAQQPPPDESVSQGSGIVRPAQAVGALRADDYTSFKGDGGLAICIERTAWTHDCVRYVTPAEYIKRQFPKREYVGFQIFVLKDGPQLYLYYR